MYSDSFKKPDTFDDRCVLEDKAAIPVLLIGNVSTEIRRILEERFGLENIGLGVRKLTHQEFQEANGTGRTNTFIIRDGTSDSNTPPKERHETLKTLGVIERKYLPGLGNEHIVIIISNTRDQMGYLVRVPNLNIVSIGESNIERIIAEITIRLHTDKLITK